jgi:hypothetical protein
MALGIGILKFILEPKNTCRNMVLSVILQVLVVEQIEAVLLLF